MIEAKNLRNKSFINEIPNTKPGYYKWWASRAELDIILSALGVGYAEVANYLEENENHMYCIYVGIAAKESIRRRLNWHVNDSHRPSRVRNGTLSTFRKSISSLVAHNQFDKAATDAFIDKLSIEFYTVDETIRSPEAIDKLHRMERKLLSEKLRPLNIQENYHPQAHEIKKRLRVLRKASKTGL